MNHRELMLSRSGAKSRHAFLHLPEELQDRIIDGIDAGELTMQAAKAAIAAAGHKLSHEAVSDYYRAVRRERRLFGLSDNFKQLMAYADQDPDKNAKTLLNLALVSAIQGLADGEIGFKDLDLARMLAATGKENTRQDQRDGQDNNPGDPVNPVEKNSGLSEATAEEIRRKILTGK